MKRDGADVLRVAVVLVGLGLSSPAIAGTTTGGRTVILSSTPSRADEASKSVGAAESARHVEFDRGVRFLEFD